MSQPEQREEVIFEVALRLAADQRGAYLDRTCASDPETRRRVEVLLGAFERAGGFLKDPAVATPARTVAVSLPPTEKPGDRIGRYKLLEQIGEGGCGVVYVAEQEEPVRRRVALKVIKLGMDTKQVLARFDAERQALALMDHPNIAKIHDAGVTDTGRPYFIMELVRGIKITDYCDQNHLPPRDRLDLFTQVCRAIQHAHQKGIIHRDIKPSNILVTLHDGVPVPKVIDFGIAKATQGRLTDQTVYTAFEQFIGTPAYMSPEQAEMSGLDIDTRSDIYSLGVLLYELLTGKTPFDAKELLAAGLDEMRRTIREVEPIKPSTRLTQERLANRSPDSAKSALRNPPSAIADDLDWIVMKCLEKDRTRRYETANGLVTDIRRHLENEPVVACPPSTAYRFQKMVRRNRLAVAAVSAVAAALVIGLGIAAWQFVEKSKAYNRAVQAEKKALTEAAKSQQVARFLKETLLAAGPSIARGRDATILREILEATTARVTSELNDQPEVQGDMYSTIGNAFVDIGEHRRAITNLEQAVTSYRLAFQGDHRNLAVTLSALGFCQSFTDDIARGSNNARLGVEMARRCDDREILFTCLWRYAGSFRGWGMIPAESEPYLREALELKRQMGNDPVGLASAMHLYSGFLTNSEESERMLRDGLDLFRQHLSAEHPKTIQAVFSLGQHLVSSGKFTEAEEALHEAYRGFQRIHDPNHPYQPIVMRFLAESLLAQGKDDEGETLYREALAMGPENANLAGPIRGLADWLASQGKFAEAESLYRKELALRRRFQGDGDVQIAWALQKIASVLRDQERFTEAETKYHESLSAFGPKDPGLVVTMNTLANMLGNHGRVSEAEKLHREAAEAARKLPPGGEQDALLEWSLGDIGKMLTQQGKLDEAEAFYRQALEVSRRFLTNNPFKTEVNVAALVDIYWLLGRYGDAEKVCQGVLSPDLMTRPQSAGLLLIRAEFFARRGRWSEAVADATKSLELAPDKSRAWFGLAPLLVQNGDSAAFRKHYQAMLARFGATNDPAIASQAVNACLLLPMTKADSGVIASLSDTALGATNDLRELTRGLAEYRQGRFASAVDWTKQALARPQLDWRDAQASMILAMAQHQLKQTDEANATLASGIKLTNTKLPRLDSGDLGPGWHEILTAHILMREAKALIEGQVNTGAEKRAESP